MKMTNRDIFHVKNPMRFNASGVVVQSRTSTNLSLGSSNANMNTSSESMNQEASAKLTAPKEFEIEFVLHFIRCAHCCNEEHVEEAVIPKLS
ncbi:hypothetical protein P879_07575 [Paragonimus westermani]|uniref:Uncharacterized protein n=1 Tax=Paragonimus westermani TaxID=34504 RepID=A0A8T0DHC6_9TREM|nr:hypothetical protein P879_07575 [Paragonimus westermani]